MDGFLEQGRNYWRRERADHISLLVDYGNYYRDLRQSIIRAKKSIFVLGWDIDSRIELMRGQDTEKDPYPNTFFELICWKARNNPEVEIYLNRWDYSMFFMQQREPFWLQKWHKCGLSNIHVCMDDRVPFSACHHQKVAVIDDDVAFWGGMDVALGRWDFRHHHVHNQERADPAQIPSLKDKEKFAPYHDINAVMSGPAARAMAEWVRVRWRNADDKNPEPVPLAETTRAAEEIPYCWPQDWEPDFRSVDIAIARTLPHFGVQKQTEEVHKLLLDEIAQAENFIYIENQFLACKDVAYALNKRLREKPNLRVIMVSCFNPNGIMERLAMWGGRVQFKDIVTSGDVADRVAITYPMCREDGQEAVVRVHSKLMIIDDRYLHVGSANINDRSMGMDTEIDVLILGKDEGARSKIASIRNDLIREHTGYEHEAIQAMVDCGEVSAVVREKEGSRQHLRPVDDEQYRNDFLTNIFLKIADPRKPLFRSYMRTPHWWPKMPRKVYGIAALLLLLICLPLIWSMTPLADYVRPEDLSALFERVKESPLSWFWVMWIYVLAGLIFVPVTALCTAVILIFGGAKGFAYALSGAVLSALSGYAIGKAIGKDRLLRFFPGATGIIDKIHASGVIGVTVLRMLPVAPFSFVNLAMGIIHVPIAAYIAGTALGLSPGLVVLSVFGESFLDVFRNPEPQTLLYAALGVVVWIAVLWTCNRLARQWQVRHETPARS